MDEVEKDRSLGGSELAVPDDIEGDVPLEEAAVVVLEDQRRIRDESGQLPRLPGSGRRW